MREQIQSRLKELKQQFEAGQIELQKLQSREDYLREAMLRINGAVHVLEELLAEVQLTGENETDPHKVELAAARREG